MKYCPERQEVEGHLRFVHRAGSGAGANAGTSSGAVAGFSTFFVYLEQG